jgi:hypothetical protein
MSTKALKASNAAVVKSPVVKPDFHELAKTGDQIIKCVDELHRALGPFDEGRCCDSSKAADTKARIVDWYRGFAPRIIEFKQGVEAYNRVGYDNYLAEHEELSCRFIGEHIAKMIGSCAVAPHNPEMYARVMIEAILEARIKDDGVELPPTPLAIEAAFRQVIRQTNKSNFAPSLPVVLEALAKQQPAWRKRTEYADYIESGYDDALKVLDRYIAPTAAIKQT